MTDTRRKAQAMLNDARDAHVNPDDYLVGYTALCRAIEQHEAFKQEVSDAVEQADLLDIYGKAGAYLILQRFIIPKPKPDPLVEVLHEVDTGPEWGSPEDYCNKIRAALEARGLEIREKKDD